MSVVSRMPAAMWTQSMTNPPIGPPARVPLKTLSGEWSHQVNTHGPLYHSHFCILSSSSDFGFERVNLNSPCTPLPYLSWPPSPPDNCPEGSNYTYTSGSAPLLLACTMCGCHSVRDHSLPPSHPPLSLPPSHSHSYRKVAGDHCVPGSEIYFLPTTRPCPVRAPRGLFISHPLLITPGQSVTFNLTQLLGSRLSTHYIWYFGDGSPTVNVTGYANGSSQVHTFHRPGTYTVNVTATNHGGTSQAVSNISVQGE